MNSLNLPSVASNKLPDIAARNLRAPQTRHQQGAAQAETRPVRVTRFPEEAALFAYNRQAQTAGQTRQARHIDEYV